MSLSGVILAAGLSRRMGFPKALLRWDDETYLDRQIRLFGEGVIPHFRKRRV